MTNEELAAAIRDGDKSNYLPLWEQVQRFANQQANRFLRTIQKSIVTAEDLQQEAFLAMIAAAQTYESDKGVFLTWYGVYLHKFFSETAGFHGTPDPAINATSLDILLPDGETSLVDLQPDPHNEPEEIEQAIYVKQLHAALERALSALDPGDADTIRKRFYEGQTLRSIAEQRGETIGTVNNRQTRGLQQLYRNARRTGLEEFLDLRTSFYKSPSFRTTFTSVVEFAAIRREKIRNECKVTTEGQGRRTGADKPVE